MTRTKPLGVADYLASPERAVALLNAVIASGGDLAAIRQAVAIVTGALERHFSRSRPIDDTRSRPQP